MDVPNFRKTSPDLRKTSPDLSGKGADTAKNQWNTSEVCAMLPAYVLY